MDRLRRRRPSHGSSPGIAYEATSSRLSKFIAIGIDFGTTYSGVSWAFSEQPDAIQEITEWPSAYHNNRGEIQVPTQLAGDKWGYEITSDMSPLKWFKLLLLRDEDLKDEIRESKYLAQGRQWLASNRMEAVDVIALYLKKLWRHTYAKLKTTVEVDNLPLRVAISIPAIWPLYAQQAMRRAAEKAGILDRRLIGATTLDLIQEPEAAGLSILLGRAGLPEIEEGESFVVCDAGGGTVDVITYTVVSLNPFEVKECVPGDLCGAVRVDEAFEAHLAGRTKLRISSLYQAEYNAFVVDDWEKGAKRNFSDASEPREFHLRPPLKLFRARDRLLNKSSFVISGEEMQTFFAKSMTGIRRLVSNQYKRVEQQTGKVPKHILLVGGLGSSPYIYGILDKQFHGTVLRPIHGWSAVARGAVIRLLNDGMSVQKEVLSPRQSALLASLPEVTCRKSRYSYGTETRPRVDQLDDFDEELDEPTVDPEGRARVDRMKWYLRRGEDVVKGSPIIFRYHRDERHEAPERFHLWIETSESVDAPKRRDDSVRVLCRMECEWNKPFSEWTPIGREGEGWRRNSDLSLAMRFDGELKWKLQVGSKEVERDVEVEYLR